MVDIDDGAVPHIEFDIVDEIIVSIIGDLPDGLVEGLFRGVTELPLFKRRVEKPDAQKNRNKYGCNDEDG